MSAGERTTMVRPPRRAGDLFLALTIAAGETAHAGRIALAYPRTEFRLRRGGRNDAGSGKDPATRSSNLFRP
jgi:hypothetical protein